ncbi:MAG: preprotein translocase subunit SecY [Chloroflexi bacterium]|nr:preprotein translocase subunit SecY [Chloroflexota bacterium]
MLQSALAALRVGELRQKLLFTFGMLILFRFIAHVPVPGVDLEVLGRFLSENQLLGVLNLLSGGALSNSSIATLGVYPYITASIILQLLMPVVPQLEALSKEGEAGRNKINQYTHWLTIPLAAGQGYAQLVVLQQAGALSYLWPASGSLPGTIAMVAAITASTMLLVWMGELITEHGIGNGVSVIIFGGIVASLPQFLGQAVVGPINPTGLVLFAVLGLIIVVTIVIFQEAHRRIPVQYAKSMFRGGRMYRQTAASHIPLRVNSAGMIPLIFAIAIVSMPGQFALYLRQSDVPWISSPARFFETVFDPGGGVYWVLYFLMVVAFTFFYTMVQFSNMKLPENLQKNGGFVPGIRPGRPTAEYLTKVLIRITWGGAIFLGLIAVTPFVAQRTTNVQALQISSTGLLIVVGVVLDTMRQLEAQLLMRQYEGFIK